MPDPEALDPLPPEPAVHQKAGVVTEGTAPAVQPKFSKAHDRVTVVENVYFQRPNSRDPAQHYVSTYDEEVLTEDGQPYVRNLKATEEWQRLAPGNWNDPCGMVIIRNKEGTFFPQRPTQEELDDVAQRVIYYTFSSGRLITVDVEKSLSIPPGKSVRFYCDKAGMDALLVRCAKGTARYTIVTLPK